MSSFFRKSWDFYSQMLIKYPITTKGLTCGVCITTSDAFTQHKQFIVSKQSETLEDSDNLEHSHELLRSIKMFTYGTLLLGPSLHFWFRALDRMLPSIVVNSKNNQTITLPFRKIPFLNKYTMSSEATNNMGGKKTKWLKVLHLDWMSKFSQDKLKWSAKRVVLEQFSYAVLVTCMYLVTTSALDLLFEDFEKETKDENRSFHEKLNDFGSEMRERMENDFRDVHQNGMTYVPIANFINFLVIPPLYRGLYFNLVGVFWNISQWAKEHSRMVFTNQIIEESEQTSSQSEGNQVSSNNERDC